jgi:hypothetical protein
VTQIVKTKFSNTSQVQDGFETPFHSLTFALRDMLRRKNAIRAHHCEAREGLVAAHGRTGPGAWPWAGARRTVPASVKVTRLEFLQDGPAS